MKTRHFLRNPGPAYENGGEWHDFTEISKLKAWWIKLTGKAYKKIK
jgi:hypothetical protein